MHRQEQSDIQIHVPDDPESPVRMQHPPQEVKVTGLYVREVINSESGEQSEGNAKME